MTHLPLMAGFPFIFSRSLIALLPGNESDWRFPTGHGNVLVGFYLMVLNGRVTGVNSVLMY